MTRHKPAPRNASMTVMMSALLVATAAMLAPAPVGAARSSNAKATASPSGEESVIEEGPSAPDGRRVVSLTFKQMGAWSAINLRGVDASRTLSFSVRADEVVVGAKLRIAYDYSPALIPELSHFKILVNERIAALEALPRDKGLANAREINLDTRLFGEVNNLRFNLIGHYTRECEDPFHSSLWLTLSDLSRIELTLAPLSKTHDLRHLPAPFFDKRDNVPLKLPFVFAGTPSFGTLKAAGVVASWFGLQAGSRGAQFPVSLNTLPQGNAVVFMPSGGNLEGVEGPAGASISIVPHPNHPRAKLLLVTGSNDAELARAANAIALIAPTLAGQTVTVTQETEAAPRKPYDAPAWVPIDRPVRFGELARLEELRVQGYFPEVVRLNYRVPPDLFTWRTPGTPVQLKYRATTLPLHQNSSLNININTSFIQTLALNTPDPKKNEAAPLVVTQPNNKALRQESIFIPPYATGGRDQLQFSYYFDVIKEGLCRNLPPDNLQASIDPESTLDFSGFPHYVALPNLAYFANIGFPFTRMADLSETAVVLPERPNTDELALYLTLMGRMGEATAYPALRHTVVSASDVSQVAARDLMVIGSSTNQSLMSQWAESLPMVQVKGERLVREPESSWLPTYRWEQQDVQTPLLPRGNLTLSGNGSLTAAMAFESPLQKARSVVLLFADKAGDLRKISDVLTDPERVSSLQGDFAVIDDKSVEHAKVSVSYYVGSLPHLSKLRWFFTDQPLLLALLGLVSSVGLAVIAYRPLRRLIDQRAKKAS